MKLSSLPNLPHINPTKAIFVASVAIPQSYHSDKVIDCSAKFCSAKVIDHRVLVLNGWIKMTDLCSKMISHSTKMVRYLMCDRCNALIVLWNEALVLFRDYTF